jgi:hypothetical protein
MNIIDIEYDDGSYKSVRKAEWILEKFLSLMIEDPDLPRELAAKELGIPYFEINEYLRDPEYKDFREKLERVINSRVDVAEDALIQVAMRGTKELLLDKKGNPIPIINADGTIGAAYSTVRKFNLAATLTTLKHRKPEIYNEISTEMVAKKHHEIEKKDVNTSSVILIEKPQDGINSIRAGLKAMGGGKVENPPVDTVEDVGDGS